MTLESLQIEFRYLVNQHKNSDDLNLLELLDEIEAYLKEADFIDRYPDEYLDLKLKECLRKAEDAIKAIKKIKDQTNDSNQLSLKF